MNTQKSIFRESALNSLNVVADIQRSLKVIDARSITYLMTAFLALAGLALWGFFGNISIEVPATGILLTKDQIELTEKRDRELRAEHQNALAAKKSLLAKKQMLYDKRYVTLDELDRAKQEYLNAEINLSNYANNHNYQMDNLFGNEKFLKLAPMEALVFVSHAEGKKITKGMHAYLLPSTLSSYEYGYINGKVGSVSEFPASKESVISYLGNASLVDEYFAGGSPFMVKIKMETQPNSASGLSWTTDNGAPFRIDAGSMVSARIISHDYHPYQLIMMRYTVS